MACRQIHQKGARVYTHRAGPPCLMGLMSINHKCNYACDSLTCLTRDNSITIQTPSPSQQTLVRQRLVNVCGRICVHSFIKFIHFIQGGQASLDPLMVAEVGFPFHFTSKFHPSSRNIPASSELASALCRNQAPHSCQNTSLQSTRDHTTPSPRFPTFHWLAFKRSRPTSETSLLLPQKSPPGSVFQSQLMISPRLDGALQAWSWEMLGSWSRHASPFSISLNMSPSLEHYQVFFSESHTVCSSKIIIRHLLLSVGINSYPHYVIRTQHRPTQKHLLKLITMGCEPCL